MIIFLTEFMLHVPCTVIVYILELTFTFRGRVLWLQSNKAAAEHERDLGRKQDVGGQGSPLQSGNVWH